MNSKIKGAGLAAVFLLGCVVGGASSSFAVKTASAQPVPPGAIRWEYYCADVPSGAAAQREKSNTLGAQYWELAGLIEVSTMSRPTTWCFKRPKP